MPLFLMLSWNTTMETEILKVANCTADSLRTRLVRFVVKRDDVRRLRAALVLVEFRSRTKRPMHCPHYVLALHYEARFDSSFPSTDVEIRFTPRADFGQEVASKSMG
jgi:hypothetical protein